jgi:hypothetical protein
MAQFGSFLKVINKDRLTNTVLAAVLYCIPSTPNTDYQQCNRVPNSISLKTELEK